MYDTYVFDKVRSWAAERNLLGSDRAQPQMVKLMEEVGETAAAVARQNVPNIADGIGDCAVVLIILAAQHGLTFEECLEGAYGVIANRTGRTENGIFIKDDE